jgi:hypothetical protein
LTHTTRLEIVAPHTATKSYNMRTKTLLFTAAALAAGLVSSLAQSSNVYSVNIVGYVNQTIPLGYSVYASPLKVNSTNGAEQVLTSLAAGDQLLLWNGGGFNVDLFLGAGTWFDGVSFNPINTPNLPSGSGFFYQNNSGSVETNTYVGEVVLSNSVALPTGYQLVGSSVAIGGNLENTNLNLPLQAGDQILLWNGGGYNVALFLGAGTWFDGVTFNPIAIPTVNVGQGFFYQNNSGAPSTWTENVHIP